MINYIYMKKKDGCVVEQYFRDEIYSESYEVTRERIYESQLESDEPVLFCACQRHCKDLMAKNVASDGLIPLKINKLLQIKPAHQNQQEYHSPFCDRYFSTSNHPYEKSIKRDESNPTKVIADVKIGNCKAAYKDELPVPNEEYTKKYKCVGNHKSTIDFRKCTVSALVKYTNVNFFRSRQFYKNVDPCDLSKFNAALYTHFINNTIYRGLAMKDATKKVGKFVYSKVVGIEPGMASSTCISFEKSYMGEKSVGKYYVPDKVFKPIFQNFIKEYNGLNVSEVINGTDAEIIVFGFTVTNDKGYPQFNDLNFMLVNKYGLYSESMLEVSMYNLICDKLFKDGYGADYYFNKPLEPENDYAVSGRNFVSDGVICTKRASNKPYKRIVVEVFGRNEPSYLEDKRTKYNSLSSSNFPLFWDCLRDYKPEHTLAHCEDLLSDYFA